MSNFCVGLLVQPLCAGQNVRSDLRQCAPLAEGSLLESAKTWKRDTACNTKNTSLKQTKGRMEVGEQLEHHIQSQS